MAESVKLRVAVHGDEITVTMPGTTFKITYVREESGLERANVSRSDLSAPISLREFISRADSAANDKARELGWGWVG
jgi:hypothetical protein